MTRHVLAWKQQEIEEIKRLAKSFPVTAIASLEQFPAELFQKLSKKLKGKAVVKVSKTRVAKKALEEAKIGNKEFFQQFDGSVALVFSKTNSFELYAFLKKNKGSTTAKPGMIAPEDIIIRAGDTGLLPGQALSDLKAAGLSVRVQGPTIYIVADKVVAKKGEQITTAVASTLAKLDIKPITVGLNIKASFENNQFFSSEVLDIDAVKVFNDFAAAHLNAFNLAFNIGYITKENIELFVSKAFSNARALAIEANIFLPETAEAMIAKAQTQASALAGMLNLEKIPEK